MPKLKQCFIILFCLLGISTSVQAQDSTSLSVRIDKVISFPDKLFGAIDKKAKAAEASLDKQTDKYLNKLAKQEARLKKKLWKKDSVLAKELFAGVEAKYTALKNAPAQLSNRSGVYSPHLDSLSTALNFLKGSNLEGVTNNPELQKTLKSLEGVQAKFNQSEQVKQYIKGRQQLLKDQFQRLGMVKEVKKYQKQVYYYQAQVREYKQAFEDPAKLEAKLMELIMKLPQFKDFFAHNSQLGQLFSLPGSSAASTASLQGLQTRASVQQGLQDRFGSGVQVSQLLQQNMKGAQSQLDQLKQKAAQYSSGEWSNGDAEMPEGFKPNNQKTKSFLGRLEYGSSIQSQRGRNYFPVTSDIGLSLGYKLNDKSSVGVGAAYKLGWGSGFNHIKITHQGVGLRSYVDMKLKGSFYMSGGYELNHFSLIKTIDQLKDYSAWQKSGLVGVSKKYKVSKKLKGSMQLLWDFLSYQQIPKAQPILFRVGYNLK